MARRKPKPIWSRLAIRELESAHAYLVERNPEAARRFASQVLDATERIRRHPEVGAVANDILPDGRYRHVIVGHHRIIYRLGEQAIVIVRVWDARQDPAGFEPD